MKHKPSHDKQLDKKIERSDHREQVEDLNWDKPHSKVPKKRRKIAKFQKVKLKETSAEEAPLLKEKQWEEQYLHEKTEQQKKKQSKSKASSEFKIHIPKDLEEQNKIMQHRTPIIRKRSHQPPNQR